MEKNLVLTQFILALLFISMEMHTLDLSKNFKNMDSGSNSSNQVMYLI